MSSVNNKRIAKNTFYLYLRMLFVMGISLYTVRAILDILGVVDYGIYNVVGGVVTMFTFMNRTLSTSSQRYFSIELAHGDKERLNKWFCLNINSFLFLGLFITFLLETVGLWFVNTQMTIPQERMFAANVVYQLSIISFLFQIVSVPYMALVVAHERMNIFAYIGVAEALGRLAIVFILLPLPYDKLIIYGILVLLLSFATSFAYVIYCWRHYPESKYYWYWNTAEVKELFGFSGWHFMGTFSTTCRSQGINILLNMFFNPVVNAARAIAYQVMTHIMLLSSNFFTAIKPQVYKAYAKQEMEEMFRLLMRSTIICAFLVSVVVYPLLADTGYILGLWLKEVPDYAVLFTQLALINGLIDATDGPLISAALATGKIRKYMLTISLVILANLPISYVALKFGCEPTTTMLISIVISYLAVFVRAWILKGLMGFPFMQYSVLIAKLTIVSVVLILGVKYTIFNQVDNLKTFALVTILLWVIMTVLYVPIIDRNDRQSIIRFVENKLKKK